MQAWTVEFVASATIAVAFLAIAAVLAVNLGRSQQWHRNPLGAGTFLIYLTCGGGHAVHTLQLFYPGAVGDAARMEGALWTLWVVDGLTAITGVWYWTMRRKFPGLVTGASVYEDLRIRQATALEIHDNVVQGLAKAKLALEVQHGKEGERAVEETLEASRRIITELLGKEDVRPGDLRRKAAAAGAGSAGPARRGTGGISAQPGPSRPPKGA